MRTRRRPLEIAAGLEAHGMTGQAAARFRHRDVFSLAEELYARVPRAADTVPSTAAATATAPAATAPARSRTRPGPAPGRLRAAPGPPGGPGRAPPGARRAGGGHGHGAPPLGGRAPFRTVRGGAAGAVLALGALWLCLCRGRCASATGEPVRRAVRRVAGRVRRTRRPGARAGGRPAAPAPRRPAADTTRGPWRRPSSPSRARWRPPRGAPAGSPFGRAARWSPATAWGVRGADPAVPGGGRGALPRHAATAGPRRPAVPARLPVRHRAGHRRRERRRRDRGARRAAVRLPAAGRPRRRPRGGRRHGRRLRGRGGGLAAALLARLRDARRRGALSSGW
ncbi:hypothetical protein NKH77_34715 [Streptomyces sp. M19]